MKFENVKRFYEWLKFVSKEEVDETYVRLCLTELEQQYFGSACSNYELSKLETKSGNPETYGYKVEIVELENGDFETKITF